MSITKFITDNQIDSFEIREFLKKEPYNSINNLIGLVNSENLTEYRRGQIVNQLITDGIIYNEFLTLEEKIDEVFKFYLDNRNCQVKKNEIVHRLVMEAKGNGVEYVLKKVHENKRRFYEIGWNYLTESKILFEESVTSDEEESFKKIYFNDSYDFVGINNHYLEENLRVIKLDKSGGGYGFDFGLQQELNESAPIDPSKFEDISYHVLESRFEVLSRSIDVWDYTMLYLEGKIKREKEKISNDFIRHALAKIIIDQTETFVKPENVKVVLRELDDITLFSHAFSVALAGGAYESGLFNAQSKKAAWEFLCGMLHLKPSETSKKEVVLELKKSIKYKFSINTGLFINEWFDFGVLLLNCDSNEFSILCISDTD